MLELRQANALLALVALTASLDLSAAASATTPSADRVSSSMLGTVTDPQGKPVPGAEVRVSGHFGGIRRETRTDDEGRFAIERLAAGEYSLTAESLGFHPTVRTVELESDETLRVEMHFSQVAGQNVSMVISATTLEPTVDMRNAEVFNKTLFTRDDQMLQQMDAGINAGQHEGGGKSLEIRRFGFNLDHGGVNGGLKVMVDDVQQNQGTQGHGQGYLGALKALSPELIGEVNIINGPFSAEYGDFSGLGVVQIRQRESLPDELTARFQGGNFIVPTMFKQQATAMSALPQDLEREIAESRAYLEEASARINLSEPQIADGRLEMTVTIENRAGHKLPTAYPSRRVWLHATVSDGDSKTIFESGAVGADGAIAGNDNDASPDRYEPHYQRIERPDQVQIYEAILGDAKGTVTTGLLQAVS